MLQYDRLVLYHVAGYKCADCRRPMLAGEAYRLGRGPVYVHDACLVAAAEALGPNVTPEVAELLAELARLGVDADELNKLRKWPPGPLRSLRDERRKTAPPAPEPEPTGVVIVACGDCKTRTRFVGTPDAIAECGECGGEHITITPCGAGPVRPVEELARQLDGSTTEDW